MKLPDMTTLRRYYSGPNGETDSYCAACAEGRKPWPGPEHQTVTKNGACRCCSWNRATCTHYPGIQALKRWEDYKPSAEPRPPKAEKAPRGFGGGKFGRRGGS